MTLFGDPCRHSFYTLRIKPSVHPRLPLSGSNLQTLISKSHLKHHDFKMRVLGTKSLSSSLVHRPKLVCKCFGSQGQRLASLIRTLTPRYEVFSISISHLALRELISYLAFLAIIGTMFATRGYQMGILVRVSKNLKPDKIVFIVGLAGVLLSLVGKIFKSILCGLLFYKQLTVGDFICLNIKDCEVIGTVESMGLMSPVLIRNLSGEIHSIPNDVFAGVAFMRMSVGPYKIISFKFAVSQSTTHKIDDIINNIDEIVRKFARHKNDGDQNFTCVESMDHDCKDIRIAVSCLVEVKDVEEYIQTKGAIILEIFKLLAEVATTR